jgi:hypothetical protein
MHKLFRFGTAFFALMFFLSSPCLAQSPAHGGQGQEVGRLLKSLDGNSWIVGESRYGISYERGYQDLRQTTLHSPPNEIGNKWFWMIYPLSNIDHLWNQDIQPFYAPEEENAAKAVNRDSWNRINGFIRNEQKGVFMLLPKFCVIGGKSGARRQGQGHYDFGDYLRITEIRVHKDKIGEFENFASTSLVPTANEYLSKTEPGVRDKLPRFLRVVKIEVTMGKVPQFETMLEKNLMPAMKLNKGTVFVYHTIYGSESNYLLLFPYEKEDDTVGTGNRALSAVWEKSYSYFDMLKVDTHLSGLIMNAFETIVKVRPELSPSLENKYSKWWE